MDRGGEHGRARLHECLRRMAAGDRDALAAFYDLTIGPAWTLALAATGGRDRDAERAVRDAYARAWQLAPTRTATGLTDGVIDRTTDGARPAPAPLPPLPWLLTLVRESARA